MEDWQKKYCFNWLFVGRFVGWIGIIASIALGVFFAPFALLFQDDPIVYTLFTFGEFVMLSFITASEADEFKGFFLQI